MIKDWANSYIGLPFKEFGRDESGVDCWGLIRLVYQRELGIELPEHLEYKSVRDIKAISGKIEESRPGWVGADPHDLLPFDIVLFAFNGLPGHIGIFVDNGYFIHSKRGCNVVAERLDSIRWNKRIEGYYRNREVVETMVPVIAQVDPILSSKRSFRFVSSGSSIKKVLEQMGIENHFVSVSLNGHPLMPQFYDHCRPRPGVSVVIRVLPAGSDDAKDILGVVATIALLTLGPALAEGLAGTLGVSTRIASGIVNFGAGLLISSLAPPPQLPVRHQVSRDPDVHSTTGISNQFSPYGPFSKIYGTRVLYPNKINEWTEVIDNDQYLRVVFGVGYANSLFDLEIDQVKIGETAIENFSGINHKFARWGDLTDTDKAFWIPNIEEDALSVLVREVDAATVRTSAGSARGVSVDITFPKGLATFNSSGARTPRTVEFNLEIAPTGGSNWVPFVDTSGVLSVSGDNYPIDIANAASVYDPITNAMYVISGTTTGATNTVACYKYDFATSQWIAIADYPGATGVSHHRAILFNDKIYCIGGTTTSVLLEDTVRIYDIALDSWSDGFALSANQQRKDHVALHQNLPSVGDIITVYGGRDGYGTAKPGADSMFLVDFAGNAIDFDFYTQGSYPDDNYIGAEAHVDEGDVGTDQQYIYLFGGSYIDGTMNDDMQNLVLKYEDLGGGAKVWIYTWTQRILEYTATYRPSVVPLGGRKLLYAGGATSATSGNAVIEAYIIDLLSGSFIVTPNDPFPLGRHGMAAAADSLGGVHFVGGYATPGAPVNDDFMTSAGSIKKTITAASSSTVRKTYEMQGLAEGAYDIRVKRVTADATSTSIIDEMYLTAIRVFKSSDPINTNKLLLWMMRIKITEQLNGLITEGNIRVGSRLPSWDGAAILNRARSNNPGWAILDALTGNAFKRTIAASKIDFDGIKAFADHCTAKGYAVNVVIDTVSPLFEVCQNLAATGRGKFISVDGKFTVLIDEEKSIVVQHFTPANSRNYSGQKKFQRIPHGLRIRFENENAGFQMDERIVYDDGYTENNATELEDMDLWGVTDPDQVWTLGRIYIAEAKLRPEGHQFETDVENLICTRGDLIHFTHDVILVGLGWGRIKALTIAGGKVTQIQLVQKIDTLIATNYSMRIREDDADSNLITVTVLASGFNDTFEVSSDLDEGLVVNGDLTQVGEQGSESIELVVEKIVYKEELGATIHCVDHAYPGLDDAVSGGIPAYTSNITVPKSSPRIRPPDPVVDQIISDESVMIRDSDGSFRAVMKVVLRPPIASNAAAETLHALFRRTDSPGSGWESPPITSADNNELIFSDVETGIEYSGYIRYMTRFGEVSGWVAFGPHTIIGKGTPPDDVVAANFTLSALSVSINWTAVQAADVERYILKRGDGASTWATADIVFDGPATFFSETPFGTGDFIYHIKAVDTAGNESVNTYEKAFTVTAPSVPTNFTNTDLGNLYNFRWDTSNSATWKITQFNLYKGAVGAGFGAATIRDAAFAQSFVSSTEVGDFWVTAVDLGENESAAAGPITV